MGSLLGSENLHCVHFPVWNFYELVAEILISEHIPHEKDIILGKKKKVGKFAILAFPMWQEVLLLSLQTLEVCLHAEVNGRLQSLCLLPVVFLLQRKKRNEEEPKTRKLSFRHLKVF